MIVIDAKTHEVKQAEKACSDALVSLVGRCGIGTRSEIREGIQSLEKAMGMLPQVEQPLEHFFCDGLYGRKRVNPAGSLIVTMIHKYPNMSFMLSGKIGVITEEGLEIMEAPRMWITKPGTKRVIYAQTDVIFCTVHPNPDNETDPEELERRLTGTFEESGEVTL